MFKDSQVTRLDAWTVTEEADAMPAVCYPAFVGTSRIGLGLDAAGLQSLPESLGEHYNCPVKPFHLTQSDLYVLHEGMVSAHLWDDESRLTGATPQGEHGRREAMRNYLPLGWLTQCFEFDGETFSPGDVRETPGHWRVEGAEIRRHARAWRREWDLRQARVRTMYEFGVGRRFAVRVEAFAPYGGETVYLRLSRGAQSNASGRCAWTVGLALQTRHGLPIFDQPAAIQAGRRTLLARIDDGSRFDPAESYVAVYGIAADGMSVCLDAQGWAATMDGPLAEAQTAWLRLDFCRHAGAETGGAAAARESLEATLAGFDHAAGESALRGHVAETEAFWTRTADIGVTPAETGDVSRRFLLHLSQHLLHCGNDHGLGGTAQTMLVHQNGWRACSFHDQHYIVDGLARCNQWAAAEAHAHWMLRVMRRQGRPFPWMMTYDGFAPIPPEADRAPMSDANRALLAIRIYELAGRDRERLLRETIYPIVRTVAEHARTDWFYEDDGQMLFRAVENDVMHDTPRLSESGTVMMFLSVLRKAIAYGEQLGVDAERRAEWQHIVASVQIQRTPDGRYRAWHNAPDDALGNDFFLAIAHIAEGHEHWDADTLRRTRDFGQRLTSCNFAWLNSSAASSEIRLGRPDRAEQFMVDTLEHTVHGPGYFEEVVPNGVSSLPPFATAHGAYLAACCEQVVLPDFWHRRVYIGRGLPSRWRNRRIEFANLRALGGLLVSGVSEPQRLEAALQHTGDPMDVELVLRVPAALGARFQVRCDGDPVPHTFCGEDVAVTLSLSTDERCMLTVSV